MREPDFSEDQIKRYLLGVTNGEDRERFEERVMADAAFKEIVLMVEDELIEDYVSGLMPPSERDMFVKGYLTTPHQVRKLKITKAMGEYADEHCAPRHSISPNAVAGTIPRLRGLFKQLRGRRKIWRLITASFAAVTLVGAILLSGATWRWYARHSFIRDLHRLNNAQSASVQLQGSPDEGLSVSLAPVLVRGGETKNIPLTERTRVVQLRLEVSELRHSRYRITLRRVGEDDVIEVDTHLSEKRDGVAAVIVNIPVGLLPQGDYQLTLSGQTAASGYEDVADYAFRVGTSGNH